MQFFPEKKEADGRKGESLHINWSMNQSKHSTLSSCV